MSDLARLTARIAEQFGAAFGHTPLGDRTADILAHAARLGPDADPEDLRDAAGALLARVLQLCTERGWDPAALIESAVHAVAHPGGPPAVPATPAGTRVAVFSSSFDPPGRYHRAAVERLLADGFDEVVVSPTGRPCGDPDAEHAAPAHRAAMADLAFRGIPGARVDLTDLDEGQFTPATQLGARVTGGEVWHVVGTEQVTGGRDRQSTIHTRWDDGPALWDAGRFVVLHAPGGAPAPEDLPPRCRLVSIDGHVPSALIRTLIYERQPVDDILTPAVAGYVARHRLFVPFAPDRTTRITLDRPRLKVVPSPGNPKAAELAERYRRFEGDPPDLVLVLGGDGTMLAAVRDLWRLRVPFLGLNCGHLGYLMNQDLPADLSGLELVTHPMPMLRVDAETRDGRSLDGLLAYQDAWVERSTGQGAWLRVEVDGVERIPKLVGDGVLVATPSGSSAYARAMGASPVPLGAPVLTLAGSNVFRPQFWKPMTLTDDVVIRVTDLGDPGKRPVRGFVDGHPIGEVRRMTVRRSSIAVAELAFTPEFDPSAKLLRSLFPPAEPG